MDGLVAKNGTLLLDYTLTLMHEGMTAKAAVIEAGKTRLKPIFMTALTWWWACYRHAFAERRLGDAREHGVGNHRRYDNINGVYAFGIAILFLWLKEKFPNRI